MDKKNDNAPKLFSFAAGSNLNTPTFSESKADWIPYGDNNLYNEFLVELLNTSSKHNSLVKKKVNMTAGEGFVETVENKEYLENINGKEDLSTIAFKCGYDLMTYGGYAYAITWSKDKKTIARHSYVDFGKVREAKQLQDESTMSKLQEEGVDFYYMSADWSNTRDEKNTPKLIQGFNEQFKDETTQLVYVTEYRPGCDYYTYPDYISSVDWIELDKEIANFHINSVKNGFTPSMIISFRGGIPSDEEMKKFNKKIQKEYAGTDNASRVFLTFSESGDTAPEFIPVNLNASDERFLQLEEQIQQNIVIAHGATPIVAGIAIAGKLGSSDEILEAEDVFQSNVIDTKQHLIEQSFNKIAKINGLTEPLELSGINSAPDIDEVVPEVIDKEAEARANLKGSVGGVTGILEIQRSVSEGITSVDAGAAVLELIYGIDPQEAVRMLQPTTKPIESND